MDIFGHADRIEEFEGLAHKLKGINMVAKMNFPTVHCLLL
ncbi:hypothetical protein BsLM_3577 [Bacillus sp. LM 4-2]|nr:hypothetical protein BsLM_3577 [Bacillus sp. LM 4-2]